ncbi:MAG: heavy-metal-associated domain-containing protein [Dysgonamonadaceae bacterium]|jgi:copper chaperone CopZ|nr:heavy-metal-associated domain-containing protein [Dysgonamonadaceae bacterium]
MKTNRFFMIFAAMFVLSMTAAVAQDNTGKTDKKKKKKDAEVTFLVNMTCENCQARIEKHIAWEKGVKDLKINLDKKLVTIKYNTEKTNEEALDKAIEALGYTSEKVEEPPKNTP